MQIELAPVGIQLEETLEVDDDLVERSPEEIINEERQTWNKEKTRKLGDDPKKYRAELRATLQPVFTSLFLPRRRFEWFTDWANAIGYLGWTMYNTNI